MPGYTYWRARSWSAAVWGLWASIAASLFRLSTNTTSIHQGCECACIRSKYLVAASSPLHWMVQTAVFPSKTFLMSESWGVGHMVRIGRETTSGTAAAKSGIASSGSQAAFAASCVTMSSATPAAWGGQNSDCHASLPLHAQQLMCQVLTMLSERSATTPLLWLSFCLIRSITIDTSKSPCNANCHVRIARFPLRERPLREICLNPTFLFACILLPSIRLLNRWRLLLGTRFIG